MSARLGKVLTVKNQKTKSFSHESDTYKAVLVKTEDGEVECLMFTEMELTKAKARGKKNTEDQLKQSWISRILD